MKRENIFCTFENWLERWFETISIVIFLIAIGWGASLCNSLFDSISLR